MALGTIELEKNLVREHIEKFFLYHESWLIPNITSYNKFKVNDFGVLVAESYSFSGINSTVSIYINDDNTVLSIKSTLNKKVENRGVYKTICRINNMLNMYSPGCFIAIDNNEHITLTRYIEIGSLLYASSHEDCFGLHPSEENALQWKVYDTIGPGPGCVFDSLTRIISDYEDDGNINRAMERLEEALC